MIYSVTQKYSIPPLQWSTRKFEIKGGLKIVKDYLRATPHLVEADCRRRIYVQIPPRFPGTVLPRLSKYALRRGTVATFVDGKPISLHCRKFSFVKF